MESERKLKGPWPQAEIDQFFKGNFYEAPAFLIDEVVEANSEKGTIRAVMIPGNGLLVTPYQCGDPAIHPRHVSGSDLIMMTANLGSLHAYFLHGCFWHEGWVGFGNRIENARFKNLCHLDSPVELLSKEIRVRKGKSRMLMDYEFEFQQDGKFIYQSKQTAMFVRPEL